MSLNFGLNDISKVLNEICKETSVTLINIVFYYLQIGNLETDEASGSPSSCCEHNIFLNEEIGEYCKSCGVVITEIKYISPLVVSKVSC